MENEKSFELWTRKEFEALPYREWNEEIVCDSLVILPTRRMHDSGFRCMDFVAIRGNKPICRCSGCSDVIHLGGIGGNNYAFNKQGIPKKTAWSIDCLKSSGLLRVFCDHKLVLGSALSSFEIFYKDKQI